MVRYTNVGGANVPLGTTGGAVADTPAYGLTIFPSSADTITLARPDSIGEQKMLICTSTSTGSRIIRTTTGAADQTVTIGPTNTIITVADTSKDVLIQLVAVSTSRWAMVYMTTGVITPALSSG
jgi:hypothetical protein